MDTNCSQYSLKVNLNLGCKGRCFSIENQWLKLSLIVKAEAKDED